jgi:endoglucanase
MKTVKLVLIAFLFVACGISGSCKGDQDVPQTPPEENADTTFAAVHGRLAVVNNQLVDKNGKPLVLRGVSFGWHNWWPRFYNADAVHTLATDWKATLVRAAMGVDADNQSYIQNPAYATEKVTTVVDAAIAEGIYAIIDFHSHNTHTAEAKTFFAAMATKYKDCPNVIYELFNEPQQQPWAEIKAYAEEVIKTIRAIDPYGIILVGSPQWDQAVNLPAADPIKAYDNIMYTLHFYAATHKQWLRDRATDALKNIPIFVSECAGMEASGDGPVDQAEWETWLKWMNNNKISWAAWSLSDKNETCSMIKDTSSPVSGWKNSDLKEWGLTVKTQLQKENK